MSESSQHDHQESVLYTEPSFCIYNTDDDKFGEVAENGEGKLERSATIGENIGAEFSFGKNEMRMIEEDEDEDDEEEEEEEEGASNRFKDLKIEIQGEYISPPIYPAKGAGGVEAEIGGGGGGEFGPSNSCELDKYYNEMVVQDPSFSNPLVLRNYALYLESKGDFSGAEEYYFRATQADPKDGEMLSQYAKLVWKLHGDQARASHYFEKAAAAAPEDSDVLAAYASFLWDIDEDKEEEQRLSDTQSDENPVLVDSSAKDFEEMRPSSPPLHLAMGLGIDNAGFNYAVDYISTRSDESTNVEEYYRRMVEENPRNPVFLRNYALFLHQAKGDLQGAEEYYSRGILEDPRDGQMLSLYAGILWQLHHDKDRAVAYFERAVEATPKDSNVLAAYAKFLWETEAEEDVIDEAQRSRN